MLIKTIMYIRVARS